MKPGGFSDADESYMRRALELAHKGLYTTPPNPRVGCVIVKSDNVVGEGWHQRSGGAHAEIAALREAGTRAKGATVYVTMEPCPHYGRTPPCCNALIDAGIARLVCATQDPSPKVNGKGFALLEEQGIKVENGLLRSASHRLNKGFFSIAERGRPWITIKSAITLDGFTALKSGDSAWISSETSRRDVQFQRARCDVLITGFGSVTADNPRLNVRLNSDELGIEGEVRQPMRLVVDSCLRTSPQARIYRESGRAAVAVGTTASSSRLADFERAGIEIWRFKPNTDKVPLRLMFERVAHEGGCEVQVEAGAGLVGALLREKLFDNLLLYVSPSLFGQGLPLADIRGIDKISKRYKLIWDEVTRMGEDLRLLLKPQDS